MKKGYNAKMKSMAGKSGGGMKSGGMKKPMKKPDVTIMPVRPGKPGTKPVPPRGKKPDATIMPVKSGAKKPMKKMGRM